MSVHHIPYVINLFQSTYLVEDDTILQLITADVDSAVDYITTNITTLSDRLPAYLIRSVT